MFANITNFFKKIKKIQEGRVNKESAKERLHLVLLQDRANVSADFLEMMKQEIIEVIKKYIEVDENEIDVKLTNKQNSDGTTGAPALYANIPIVGIKNETRKMSNKLNLEKLGNKKSKDKNNKEKKEKNNSSSNNENKDVKNDENKKVDEEKDNKSLEKETKSDSKKKQNSENSQEKNDKENSKETNVSKQEKVDEKVNDVKEKIEENNQENQEEKVESKKENTNKNKSKKKKKKR